MGATTYWNVSDTDFPANATPRDKLRFVVKHALLVPPEGCRQAWDFRISDDFVELIADDTLTAQEFDPERREPMIGCGAALEFLIRTLKRYRCWGRLEMFPELDQPTLVARIYAGSRGEQNVRKLQLFEAMTPPRQNPLWPNSAPVTDATLEALRRAVAWERAWLEFAWSEISQKRLRKLTATVKHLRVEKNQVQAPATIRSAVHSNESCRSAGSILRDRLARWRLPFLPVKARAAPAPKDDSLEEVESALPPGLFAVLKTKTDDKRGWVAAGQTMARLILHTQILGLSCAFFNEALRMPTVREELRPGVGRKGFVQAILRLGSVQSPAAIPSNVVGLPTPYADAVSG